MFKEEKEEKIDAIKGSSLIKLKSKIKKEVVQLNHKDNQKQYELNAKLDVIAKANNTRMDVNVSLNSSLKVRQCSKGKAEVDKNY